MMSQQVVDTSWVDDIRNYLMMGSEITSGGDLPGTNLQRVSRS